MPVSAHAERLRLAALRAYEVLESAPSPELDGLVALAAHVTGAPLAMVSLMGADRQWQAAVAGDGPGEVPREVSLCTWSVENRSAVHTADASQDPRFAGNPFVDGRAARVRLYAAAPLLDDEGNALGTLCVYDEQARALTRAQLDALGLLARQVVSVFEGRRRAAQLAEAVAELDRLAHLDGLTGLVNRAAAARSLERVCTTGGYGLVFLDVDDFKAVNDGSGHAAGDRALQEVAARLREALRPHDLLARWSGDEFVALLADVEDDAQVQEVVRRLVAQVRRPHHVDGHELRLSVSAGGVVVPAGSTPQHVLHAADRAMYEAKRRHRAERQASA